MFLSYKWLLLFEVAFFYLHVCRTTVAMETNFPPFCSPLLKSHGYEDITEFSLIFTINTTYTPNIFTGEWVNRLYHTLTSVADPEGDPRVPWIPPFRLNIACKNRTPSNLQRSNSLSKLALLSCLYSLVATNNH